MKGAVCLALLVLATLAGCRRSDEDAAGFDFERMRVQPRYDAYEASDLFEDGAAMQPPPPGTVPRERQLGPPEVVDGAVAGQPVPRVPIPVTRQALESGRHHFEIVCGACHGPAGNGRTPVAAVMEMRPAPSLLDERIRRLPDGAIYRVVREGYGLMPSYAAVLSVQERWQVVAYLRALQWSQGISVDELPPAMRRELAEATRSGAEAEAGEGGAR